MRVLSISSQVVWGPVGNSAAVPALQAKGHEVLALPTVILSNHPGHGAPQGFRVEAGQLGGMLCALHDRGALVGLDAVLTGYFASAAQVAEVAALLPRLGARHVLVDPVLGDHGRLYVPAEVADAIRDRLLPLASLIAPNAFELAWLSGLPVTGEAEAVAAARALAVPEVLATSIPAAEGRLATLAITAGAVHRIETPKFAAVPNGTGDFLSGLYLAERLSAPPELALPAAMTTLTRAIARSAGTAVLDVSGALSGA